MKILITNDDGYKAGGIRALVRAMKKFGEITVVAPKHHQSGMSMAVSLGKLIAVKDLGFEDDVRWYYVDGTPASCVKYAIDELFTPETWPDVVISGINHGSNASTAMWYSGTIGAARESCLVGIPSIGVSLDNMSHDADFSVVEELFPAIFEQLMAVYPKGGRVIYNVNFPDIPKADIRGIRVCVQGDMIWVKEFVHPSELGVSELPPLEEGENVFMMAGAPVPGDNPAESDNIALEEGYIAITPQAINNTDFEEFRRLQNIGISV